MRHCFVENAPLGTLFWVEFGLKWNSPPAGLGLSQTSINKVSNVKLDEELY